MPIAPSFRLRLIALWLAPFAAIFAARIATHSELAGRYPRAAGLLFVWIAADSLTLALIAKTPGNRPGLRAALGTIFAGCVIATLGAAQSVRAALLDMEAVIAAMALTGAAFLGWSLFRAFAVLRRTGSWQDAAGEILPAQLVKFAAFELGMMRLALVGWHRRPEVPNGALAFAGHRIENQMIAVMLALQVIEIGVVHLVISHWSMAAALILLALGVWGVMFTLALMNGLRIYPVLLMQDGIRLRAGPFTDVSVPLAAIASIEASISHEECKRRDVLRASLLTHPNIVLRLDPPLERRDILGRPRAIARLAFRLDDPAPFIAALRAHIQRRPA